LKKQEIGFNRRFEASAPSLSFVTIQTALHASLAPRDTFANVEINFDENLFITNEA
jgi:hypothetical protein